MDFWASLVAQMAKNLPATRETWVLSLCWEEPLGGGHGNSLLYSCLENPHGQKNLVGYSPWGCKESDTTEVTKHALTDMGAGFQEMGYYVYFKP